MSVSVELSARARQGEPEALAQLLAASEPDMRRFAARVCRSAADADDAVQHALITVSFRLDSFRGLSRLSTWVFSVIRNECRKYERLARRWVTGEEADPEVNFSANADPESEAERAEHLELLVGAIRQLNPALRSVFILRELEELSTAECASELGLSEANVKVRLHRAREELRRELLGKAAS